MGAATGLDWVRLGTGWVEGWPGTGLGLREGAERKEEDGLESETLGHPPMVLRTADY